MSLRPSCIVACLWLTAACPAMAASDEPVPLIVRAGRPLRVQLDERISVRHVGQPVTATVIESVYAYDRIVIPAGARVSGRIEALEHPSRWSRARTMLGGDFTPRYVATLEFDTLLLPDGSRRAMSTRVGPGRERVALSVASRPRESHGTGRVARQIGDRAKDAASTARRRVADAISALKSPSRMQRLKEAAVNQLPYHPQYLHAGTVYVAELLEPLEFGTATPIDRALADAAPAPESILQARLVTALDSAATPRGTPMQAELTEPVFSTDHRLIFPEGTTLDGEVTFAKPARSLHRNGQLRFLIEGARVPEHGSQTLLASLHAVEAAQDDRIVVDDEGGARVSNAKTRFIPPAIAVLSVHAALDDDSHRRFDNDADDTAPMAERANVGGRGLAGWVGLGLVGAGVGQFARPVAVAFGIWGAARSTYSNVLGKGHDVSFPANTLIQVQLSPGADPQR